MRPRNTSIPTRYRKHQPNWYALAAVATALQLSVEFEDDICKFRLNNSVDIDEEMDRNEANHSTTTVRPFDILYSPLSVSTMLAENESEEDFEDVTVKPKYVKEFKIKVGSLKIDRSAPKIFVD